MAETERVFGLKVYSKIIEIHVRSDSLLLIYCLYFKFFISVDRLIVCDLFKEHTNSYNTKLGL